MNVLATVVSLVLAGTLVGGCARDEAPAPTPSPIEAPPPAIAAVGTIKEFTFPGGRFQDGQVMVAADTKVEQDPESKSVMLRMAGGAADTKIDCNCTSGSGGSCFPVTQSDPLGGILVLCASIDPCNDCDQVITVPGSFSFRAACKRVAQASNQ